MGNIYEQRKRPHTKDNTPPVDIAYNNADTTPQIPNRAMPAATSSFDLDGAMQARMANTFGDLSAVRNYTPPKKSQAVVPTGPYIGPVTHAISDASPSPAVAGPMQALRGDSEKQQPVLPAAPSKEEKAHESEEEKNWKQMERLFRIEAGLQAGNPDLVSAEDRTWHEKTLNNASPAMIRDILKRRDEKGVELMKHRRTMEENNPENKSGDRLNYEARNSPAAYDMDIYHILAKRTTKNRKNFLAGSSMHDKTRSKETASDVRDAYGLLSFS